jgi:hypothetical protein
MNSPNPSRRRIPPPLIFWILWIGFLGSIGIYQVELGGGLPHGANQAPQAWNLPLILAALQVSVATVIRWFVIPKVTDQTRLLPLMVVGLALSEAVAFYGIFLIGPDMPQTKLQFLLAAFCCTLQFAPYYAPARPAGWNQGRVQ